ncbi:MAG: polysaccharide pyruvyl transferase family protein [Pseudomonadota bacterium]
MSALMLMRRVRREGAVPLAWQGGSAGDARVPLGGALSPVVVALLTGLPVTRVPFASSLPRLVASGTIGQNIRGGDAVFWGTGAARTETPPDGRRRRFRAAPGTARHLTACRGPFSAALLSGGAIPAGALPALGEPAALIAAFHRPTRAPRHELGVVLDPDEEAAAPPGQCRPHPHLARYALDPAGGEGVRLISGLVAPSLTGIRQALDAILSCRRIASAAPEPLAIARAYGIPALPLARRGARGSAQPGLADIALSIDGPLELPLADLLAGYGQQAATVWHQPADSPTPWARLIAAIDHAAASPEEAALGAAHDMTDALAAALPLDVAPAHPVLGSSIWDEPNLKAIAFAEDLPAMRARETAREAAAEKLAAARRGGQQTLAGAGKVDGQTIDPAAMADPWAAAPPLPLAMLQPTARAPKLRLIRLEPSQPGGTPQDAVDAPPQGPVQGPVQGQEQRQGRGAAARSGRVPAATSGAATPLGLTALWHLRRGLAALESPGAGAAITAEKHHSGTVAIAATRQGATAQAALALCAEAPGAPPTTGGNITRLSPPARSVPTARIDDPEASAKPRRPASAVAVPLCWAAGGRQDGFANIGDALSAVVVATLSGLPVRHMATRSPHERLAAVGTIGHSLKGGHVHLWGTGLDATLNPERDGPWSRPSDTRFSVHATRGPETAATLRRHGVAAPEVFGDPVYLLPRLWPLDEIERRYELGIVLHLSELDEKSPAGRPKAEYRRYAVPESLAGSVRIINMYAESSLTAFRDKIAEIVSCRRILSTSLHGLVIADAYGIPSGWYGFHDRGLKHVDLLDPESRIDHRMRDLYGGLGWHEAPVYATSRHEETDFDAAIAAMDAAMTPSGYDPAPLIEAFPGPLGVDPAARLWPLPQDALEGVIL